MAAVRSDPTVLAVEVLSDAPPGSIAYRAGNGIRPPRWHRQAIAVQIAALTVGLVALTIARWRLFGEDISLDALRALGLPLLGAAVLTGWLLHVWAARLWPTTDQARALVDAASQAIERAGLEQARAVVVAEADTSVEQLAAALDALHDGRPTPVPPPQRVPLWLIGPGLIAFYVLPLLS